MTLQITLYLDYEVQVKIFRFNRPLEALFFIVENKASILSVDNWE